MVTLTPKFKTPVMADTQMDLHPDSFCVPTMRAALEETDLTFAQDIRSYIEFVLSEPTLDTLSADVIY